MEARATIGELNVGNRGRFGRGQYVFVVRDIRVLESGSFLLTYYPEENPDLIYTLTDNGACKIFKILE